MPIRSQFDTPVGTIRIDIQDADTIYTEAFSIGSLRYQFGQTPDQISIDRTLAVYSQFEVTINQMSAESIDLYERLFDATDTNPLKVNVTIIRFDGSEYAFVFELKQENIAQSEKDKTLKLKFTPRLNSNATISNVFSAASSVYPYTLYDLEGNATNVNSLPAGDFIAEAMSNIFDNSFDPLIITSNGAGAFYTGATYATHDSWENGQRGLIVADYTSNVTFPITSNTAYTITESTSNLTNVYHDRQGGGTAKLEFNKTGIESEFSVGDRIIIDELYGGAPIEIVPESITNVNGKLISTSVEAISAFDEEILANVPYKIKKFKSPADSNAIDVLKELAGIESSYFGNGFSKNFYVYPLSEDTSNVVTLRYDYVNDINIKRYNNYLGDSAVRQIADATRVGTNNFGRIATDDDQIIPNLRNFSAFVKGNENASKSLSINIAVGYPHVNKATLNTTTNVYTSYNSNTITNDSPVYDVQIERNLASRGLTGYMHVLTNRSGGTRIDMEYQGALSLFPYSVFQFDSTAPEKYQNKQFRIVSIQYDFVKDIIKVSAYQVSSLATDVVDDGTEVTNPNRSRTIEYDIGGGARWNLVGNPTTKKVQYTNPLAGNFNPPPFFGTLVDFPYYYTSNGYVTSNNNVDAFLNPVPYPKFESGSNGIGYFVALVDNTGPQVRDFTWDGDINTSNIDGLQLFEGWNLIAGPGLVSNIVDGTANIRQEAIYGFRNKYEVSNIIEPGRGYWVYAENAGTIDIKISSTPIAQANLQEDFKRIDITSGTATQSVYFDGTNTNTNVNVQHLQLPPAIGNAFDVRINQDKTNTAQRNLRAFESNTVSIDVNLLNQASKLNIVPKIGDAASSSYQCTFLSGYDIITASNVTENVVVDIPPLTTQIQVKPMGNSFILPVRDIDFTNPDGTIPERFIDRSDVLSFTPSSTLIVIPVTTETTAVNMTLGDEAQYNFIAFGIDTPRNGQEILVTVSNPDEKQFLISQGSTAYSPLLLPGDTQIERSEDNVVFKFRYNDALSGWVLVYENSQGAISDPIEEPNPGIVVAPSFIPSDGTYTGNTNLSIVTTTSGADIFYNTDGSNTYLAYTSPIVLTEGSSYNVRAYATKSGLQPSEITYGGYVINVGPYQETPDLPVIVPSNQSFYNSLNVEMYTSNSNPARTTNIYYTIDGTVPDANSTRYAGAITIYNDTLFRAVAKYDDSSELTDVVDKSYTKVTSVTPSSNKWSIISHPFAYPLTERAIRLIFNSRKGTTFEMTDSETWVKVSNYIDDLNQGFDAPLPVKAEPGRGYWIYVDNPVESLDFNNYLNTRFNLLSNDNERAQSASSNTLPYYWSGSNSNVTLNARTFNLPWEIEFVPTSYPYTTKLYLDEIVIRNYQSSNYTLDATMFAIYNSNATFKFGVETYDINKASISNTNSAITITSAVEDFSEEFTGVTGYYVRPFIEVSEAFKQDTERLYLYIRKQKFSAEPGFMLNTVSHNVSNGWSTVGAIGGRSNINTDGSIIGDIFSYSNGVYAVENIDNLRLGRGYFVQFANSNTYNVQLTDEVAQAGVNLNNSYKRVQLSRQDGVFSVFFDGTSNTINASEYTVPPAVGGNFDVRINQDETNVSLRDRRVVESNTINIDIQQIDSATTLNITPKINVAAGSYYQATFLDGDKIITAQNIAENVAVDVPITTTRITLQPMGANIKLPVRARDIANDDGEILDTVSIEGVTGAISDRIQYLNSSGELTELITAGSADFIQTVVSRPEFSSKQNNVPSKGQVLLMSYDGTGSLTDNEISGFTAGTAGKLIRVINVGSNTIVLSANDTGSSAGNRILGSDVSLGQYESATLIYVEDYVDGLSTTNIDAWILISNT